MILDRVTMTGADDSVGAGQLAALSEKYPFVEWGILFSGTRQGQPRYPSTEWLSDLSQHSKKGLRLSAHLCGKWVRSLVLNGSFIWIQEYEIFAEMFTRVQLNFHGHFMEGKKGWTENLKKHHEKQYILQYDGANDAACDELIRSTGFSAVPLFDKSGGAGIVPGEWPKAMPKVYCGYAGGLGPETLRDELARIDQAAGPEQIWIDMETRVRSENDKIFDLEKVEACLKITKEFVKA